MNFSELMKPLGEASLFDLFRMKVMIQNIIDDPVRIKELRQSFAVGDTISYFDVQQNSLIEAVVLEKKKKFVLVKNRSDGQIGNIKYYMLNLQGRESDILAHGREKLTKNHLKVGDFVGFDHDGEQTTGSILKLNAKTVSLITPNNKRWRVPYGMLFKVLDGETVIEDGVTLIANHKQQGNKLL
jgi:hypothetical protein